MSSEVLLKTENLCKSFGKRKVIDNLNLLVEAGDIYGFLGPNGSGKTTTIRLVLGLIYPDTGTVYVNGMNIKEQFNEAIANVGAIVESPSFYSYLSGRENLKLIANLYPNVGPNKIDEVLEMVKLTERAKDKVKTYSLGMKQRLGIAMALLNSPRLVILDEPTNGLDPQGMKEVKEMIMQLAKEQGITFFISSHLLHEVEQICTKVGVLKQGKLLAQEDVKQLLKSDYETIEVHTSDKDKAMDALNACEFVKKHELSQNGVIVEIDKGNAAKLNQFLMSRDVMVGLLQPLNNSLEDFFFELTEGGNTK
jgi:ABC-type multidrug transport system ATPase subunit